MEVKKLSNFTYLTACFIFSFKYYNYFDKTELYDSHVY